MSGFFLRISTLLVICFCSLGLTTSYVVAAEERNQPQVLMQLDVPPASCMTVEGQDRNLLVRHLKKRDKAFRPRALIRRLRNRIKRVRSKTKDTSLSRKRRNLRRRIQRFRTLIRFSRQCMTAEVIIPEPDPDPEQDPPTIPDPEIEPTPIAPGHCDSVEYSFEAESAPINGDGTVSFYFREAVPCGQFVDGTWWVKGPVKIRRMTPDYLGLIPNDASTYPLPMLETLQAHLDFKVGQPLCAHEPDTLGCITPAESEVISDFFQDHFAFSGEEATNTHYRNGYMVDPVPDGNSFDSRFNSFTDPVVSLPLYDQDGNEMVGSGQDLLVEPLDGDAKSVVKVGSRHDIRNGSGWSSCNPQAPFNLGNRGCINSTAILTVVSRIPEEDAFRPSYYGLPFPKLGTGSSGSNYYRSSKLNLDKLAVFSKEELDNSVPEISDIMRSFNGPWTFFFNHGVGMSLQQAFTSIRDRSGGFMHYHSSIANAINAAMLRTMHSDPIEERLPLIEQIVQRGIDYYYGLHAGKNYDSGTGFNMGFKAPILYAGLLLEEPAFLNVAQDFNARGDQLTPNGRPVNRYFAEDSQTYFGADTFEGRPIALWGNVVGLTPMTEATVAATLKGGVPIEDLYDDLDPMPTFGGFGGFPNYYLEPYVGTACGSGGNRTVGDPKGQRHGGYWVSINTDQRPIVGVDGDGDPIYSCPRTPRVLDVIEGREPAGASAYQYCCSSAPMTGSYTVATLLDLREEWGHEPFFEYVEQWLKYYSAPGTVAGNYGDSYIRDMLFTFASPLEG